jgi:hypothetical protein
MSRAAFAKTIITIKSDEHYNYLDHPNLIMTLLNNNICKLIKKPFSRWNRVKKAFIVIITFIIKIKDFLAYNNIRERNGNKKAVKCDTYEYFFTLTHKIVYKFS